MPGGTDEPGDGDEAEQPTILIDAKTMHCVVDLRSLIALPANSEEDALLTLRAFFLQKGKTIRVPEHAGHYATLEKYVAQVALCKVFFASSTKRPPELLVAWGDYSKLSLGMEGQFAVSLRLPLQKSFRNFEETLRYTKIEDVRGVSPINAKIQPWCTVLPLVLARQPMYALHNIKSQADIMQLMVTPLAVRIKQIAKITIAEIATIVKDTAEQDERAAEKKKGELEARLVSALKFLAQLPPKSYDKRTADRIVVLLTEKAPPPWLSSPQKSSLRKGDAVLQMTCMHVAQLQLHPLHLLQSLQFLNPPNLPSVLNLPPTVMTPQMVRMSLVHLSTTRLMLLLPSPNPSKFAGASHRALQLHRPGCQMNRWERRSQKQPSSAQLSGMHHCGKMVSIPAPSNLIGKALTTQPARLPHQRSHGLQLRSSGMTLQLSSLALIGLKCSG